MDSNGHEPDKSLTEQEGVLFPSNPIWERGRKRRGLGGRTAPAASVAPEPRSFAADDRDEEPMTLDTPVSATTGYTAETPAAGSPGYVEPMAAEPTVSEERESLVAPVGPSLHEPRSGGIGTGAVVAALAGVAVLGAGGWYMLRDRDTVPVLTPGSTTTEVATTAPLTPAAPPPEPTAAAPAPAPVPAPTATAAAEPPRVTVRTERRMASAARARPAATAPSAETTGIDASATLPDGPQPYSAINPGAAPAPVSPPVNPAPSATTQPSEPIPSTPPTAPQASPPSTTPDPTPQSATPPQ